MKHCVVCLGFPLLLFLNGCSSNPTPDPPIIQKLDTRYVSVGKPITIDLNWKLKNPIVKVSGRRFNVQPKDQSLILTLPKNAWGGPQNLVIQDGKHKAIGILNVLRKSSPEEQDPDKIEFISVKSSQAERQKVINKIQKTIIELGGKSTVKVASLGGGPGACGNDLIEATITKGDFEKILTDLDKVVKKEPRLMSINPATIWRVDPMKHVPTSNETVVDGGDLIGRRDTRKRGFYGYGAIVAVFDTGLINPSHQMADENIIYEINYVLNGQSFTKEGQSKNIKDNYPALTEQVDKISRGLGHGTQVSMLISSWRFGIAPGAGILPIKVCDANGECRTRDILRGVCWVMRNHVSNLDKVIFNFSIGSDTGGFAQDSVTLLLKSAIAKGVNVVASAGNHWKDFIDQKGSAYPPKSYPAALSEKIPEIMAVGSVHQAAALKGDIFKMANYSNRGKYVDILAPGFVYAVDTSGDNTYNIGTSFAAPFAAGAIALWQQRYPNATPKEIKQKILNGAGSIQLAKEDKPLVTNGLLDLTKLPGVGPRF